MTALFEKTKRTEYYVTTEGYILSKRIKDGFIRKKKLTINKKRGYYYLRTKTHNYSVHRLVASAFINNSNNKETVNHIDGNKLNNNISNLEWMTPKENNRHAIENGLSKKIGKNEGNIKYTNEQCKDVLLMINNGMTYKEAGSKYKMPYSTVAHLARGSRRKI